jgi:hypothetical protein
MRSLLVAALFIVSWTAAAADGVPDETVKVLDGDNSFVRWVSVQRPAVIVGEPGAAERTLLLDPKKIGPKIDAKAASQVTPPLPAGWIDAAFDDAAWPRARINELPTLAFISGAAGPSGIASQSPTKMLLKLGVLALRGKFNVTDPATARLTLSLKYRGGVVVYLNGQEIARGALPAGPLTASTPGGGDFALPANAGLWVPGPGLLACHQYQHGRRGLD